jgi:NTP pyrophosphatase (non-canonical NTP hydrolase)
MNIQELLEKLKQVMAIYSEKYKIDPNEDYYLLKIQEELGELSSAHLKLTNRARKNSSTSQELQKNFEDEIADVLAMTLLFAESKGLNVEEVLQRKWLRYLS